MYWGALHFLAADRTAQQLPESAWIPGAVAASIVAITGILELLFAVMLVFERWRVVAAFGQMTLLVVFLPSVVWMLINDEAIATIFPSLTDFGWARFGLVLHNVLLFLWALWVLELEQRPVFRWPRFEVSARVLLTASVLLFANIAGFGVIVAAPWQASTPSVWAMACLALGGLVGFVFGVPRPVPSPDVASASVRYAPNANIEVLSDWLTKIIVGVGLVELGRIRELLATSAHAMASGFFLKEGRVAADPDAFAAGVIVFFVSAGLIEGYLLTRMCLSRVFASEEFSA